MPVDTVTQRQPAPVAVVDRRCATEAVVAEAADDIARRVRISAGQIRPHATERPDCIMRVIDIVTPRLRAGWRWRRR